MILENKVAEFLILTY